MAYEIPGFKFTLPAAADLSASQHCFVTANASGQAALATTAVDIAGVLCNDPAAAGIAAEVGTLGIYKVKAGAAIASIGTRVMADGSGRAITATSTNKAVGYTLSVAGAANEIISVFVAPMGTF